MLILFCVNNTQKNNSMQPPIFKELENKVVVITGGGGILCSTLAESLAAQNAKVAILDLNEEAAQTVAEKINGMGGTAQGFKTDVLSKQSLEETRKKVLDSLGKCDILINGAGGNHPKGTTTYPQLHLEDIDREELTTFFKLDPDGIQFVFNLNFIGTLLPTQVFALDMVGRKKCSIINISSMNAFRPLTKIPAYSGAKAAVSNFTQWLAVHFAPLEIRVNALAPGFFLTDQNRSLLTKEGGDLTPRGETILEHTPMKRFGTPSDLIGTVLWLSTDLSEFVTGTVIPVDGGFSAFSGV